MPENKVRDIFIARIKQLMTQYEGSRTISHGPTVGAMREDYLKSFIREMFPPKYSPVSGFIVDKAGKISNQLDMVFIDRSELPTISLINDTVVIPCEIALLTVEVKSEITSGTLNQIKDQRKAIEKMEFNNSFLRRGGDETRNRNQIVPTMIMSFTSQVSDDELRRWVHETSGLEGICVLDKISIFPYFQNGKDETFQLNPTNTDDYRHILTFIGSIYRILHTLEMQNSPLSDQEYDRIGTNQFMWFWESYLSDFFMDLLKQQQRPSGKRRDEFRQSQL